jgi:ABC-type multidrug transport system fused ATPase/permease subunit
MSVMGASCEMSTFSISFFYHYLIRLSIRHEIKEDESVGTMKRSRVPVALLCLFSYGNLPITTTSAFSIRPAVDRTAISTSTSSLINNGASPRRSSIQQQSLFERTSPTATTPRAWFSSTALAAADSPAISMGGVSCTHNGGETWQLQDVSYVLQRGAKAALVGRNGTGGSCDYVVVMYSFI